MPQPCKECGQTECECLTKEEYIKALTSILDTNRELRTQIAFLQSQEHKDEIISNWIKQYGGDHD